MMMKQSRTGLIDNHLPNISAVRTFPFPNAQSLADESAAFARGAGSRIGRLLSENISPPHIVPGSARDLERTPRWRRNVGSAGDPARPVKRDATARHDHVDVRMVCDRRAQVWRTERTPMRAPNRLAVDSWPSASCFMPTHTDIGHEATVTAPVRPSRISPTGAIRLRNLRCCEPIMWGVVPAFL